MASNSHELGRQRGRWAVAATVAWALATACAKDTADVTRKNWDRAVGKADAAAKKPPSVEAAAVGAGGTTPWGRVRAILTRADAVLALGGGDEAMEILASRWCAVEPTPQPTDHGPVRVCRPEPALVAGGHGLILEMGTGLGLTAQDLDEPESVALAAEMRAETRALCQADWRAPAGQAREGIQVHTCPLVSGATLALGRFLRDTDNGLWQVSIAVLGPG